MNKNDDLVKISDNPPKVTVEEIIEHVKNEALKRVREELYREKHIEIDPNCEFEIGYLKDE